MAKEQRMTEEGTMMAKSEKEKEQTVVKRQIQADDNSAENGQGQGKPTGSQGLDNMHYRDSSGKIIFKDPILCSQFLRDYVDIPMLKDVQPEDIEDVTERFVHMFVEERDSDVVKKVNLKNNSFYLISLIEHKSDVDYNVIMQVFRYITFIWEDYENEQEKIHEGISKTKGFRYPPVLPIVFYDGVDNWTAATSLHERVLFSDILGKYIPDYQCMLIQLKEYSSAELMEKRDELSLLMMIDKLRNVDDYEELRQEWNEPLLKEVIKDSPEYLLKLMSQVIRMFLSKLNVPQEEADTFTEQVKERKMGELFKHFEGWDIQEVRRECAEKLEKGLKEAREEVEKAKAELEKEKEAMEKEKEAMEKEKEAMEKAMEETKSESIRKFLGGIKKYHASKEEAVTDLMEEYKLSEEEAAEKVAMYWQEV